MRAALRRNGIAAILYALAIPAAWLHPAFSLALIVGVSLFYLAPDAMKQLAG